LEPKRISSTCCVTCCRPHCSEWECAVVYGLIEQRRECELGAAPASMASAIIVAITAIAAFLQIRHVRNANEIAVYLRLVDRLDSLEPVRQ